MKRILTMIAVLAVALASVGCCGNPGIFGKVNASLKTTQGYYDPLLIKLSVAPIPEVKAAVVAADTALLLAGELQKQWCPSEQAVDQLALQTAEAKKIAEAAGVK